MWLLLLAACANDVADQYEAARVIAVAPAPAVPEDRQPDLAVRLSEPALTVLAGVAVASGLLHAERSVEVPVAGGASARLSPSVGVQGLKLSASSRCEACLDLALDLEGSVDWTLGRATGTVPVRASATGTIAFEARPAVGGFNVAGALRDLTAAKVEIARVGSLDASPALGDWVSQALAGSAPIVLGQVGGGELPLLGLWLRSEAGGLILEGRTDAPLPSPLPPRARPLDTDWDVAISQGSALSLARRAAFERGPGDDQIAVEPRHLAVTEGGFQLALRVWRVADRGWWRDYRVDGAVALEQSALHLRPERAEEGERSEGAALADPLALLGEGLILDQVEGSLDRAVPASHGASIGDLALVATLSRLSGEEGALVLAGGLAARPNGHGAGGEGEKKPKKTSTQPPEDGPSGRGRVMTRKKTGP